MEDTTKEDIEAMDRYIADNCERVDRREAKNIERYKKLDRQCECGKEGETKLYGKWWCQRCLREVL